MTLNRSLRRGVSLMEVLIAIGILALGLVSIMAMFPVGAVNMIQAIKDDRCAQAGSNASATFRTMWKQWYLNSDGSIRDSGIEDYKSMFLQPWIMALDDSLAPESYPYIPISTIPNRFENVEASLSDPTQSPLNLPPIYNPAVVGVPRQQLNDARRRSTSASHFVMIDPIGHAIHTSLGAGLQASNVAGIPGFIPRRTLSSNEVVIDTGTVPPSYTEGWFRYPVGANALFTGSRPGLAHEYRPLNQIILRNSPNNDTILARNTRVIRFTSLLDDMSFERTGIASTPGGQYDRGARYNCAWFVQRPNSSERSRLRVKVMVFDGRPVTDTAAQELIYGPGDVSSTPAVNQIAITGPDQLRINITATGRPPLKKGGWILLAGTPTSWSAPALGENLYPISEFYRVRAVQEVTFAGNKYLDLDLEQPLANVQAVPLTSFQASTYLVIFDQLAEVFDRGVVSTSSVPPW